MQTSVSDRMPVGIPGQLADLHSAEFGDVVSATNEEASAELPFGVMVKDGTGPDLVKNVATTNDRLAGVIVHAQNFAKPVQLGDTGLKPGVTFGVLRKGRIYVRVEDAVEIGDEVHVRAVIGGANGYGDAGAESHGAFRGTQDGTDTIDITAFAKWVTEADAGEVAVVEIDMNQASLAVADS